MRFAAIASAVLIVTLLVSIGRLSATETDHDGPTFTVPSKCKTLPRPKTTDFRGTTVQWIDAFQCEHNVTLEAGERRTVVFPIDGGRWKREDGTYDDFEGACWVTAKFEHKAAGGGKPAHLVSKANGHSFKEPRDWADSPEWKEVWAWLIDETHDEGKHIRDFWGTGTWADHKAHEKAFLRQHGFSTVAELKTFDKELVDHCPHDHHEH